MATLPQPTESFHACGVGGFPQSLGPTVEAIVVWYLKSAWRQPHDGGLFPWLANEDLLGAMAVDPEAVQRGEDAALFKTLITLAMFQRLQDALVAGILRSFSREDAEELTTPGRLLMLSQASGCGHGRSQESLLTVCDLAKDPVTRLGVCTANPGCACHLKRHTVLLRRYGHFGKVPTSAALALQESWGGGLSALRARVFKDQADGLGRARALEAELSRVWRVHKKVACMVLSVLSAPDLGLEAPPWHEGLDWTYFLPIDVNIDAFLRLAGWSGHWTYEGRREAMREVGALVHLSRLQAGLTDYNPRLVLQAINRFMSRPNRRQSPGDCSREAPASCLACAPTLRASCPFAKVGKD